MTNDPSRLLIVASNRGPVSYSHAADGSLTARRGGGGMVSGLMSVVFALSASFNLINARVFLKRPIRPGIAAAAGVGALGLCIAF